ncbi:glycosyltransferase 87 family protein [Micromonospora sp. R77]|uniref:glycosyltransferase 87 family protein n=1 Tax=Micromonospora sp. R77 TaxID=2925836 RepID=UPI001F6115DC|nr:glycosyltransferase 87 family protein [Micromonospora sp. R77]MCI4065410.1 glycosyltransferase 87 family protein [Micromonospora sp. R77]
MLIQRIRRIAADASADHTARPRVTLPNWLLIPGLALLVLSVAAYVAFVRDHPFRGTDFNMYLGAAHAFLDGEPVYQLGYTRLQLPYTYPPITLPFLVPLTWFDDRTALNLMNAVGVVAMLAALWFTTRILGYEGTRGRLGLVAAAGAVVLWTEPLQRNLDLGQINIFVMLLVVADLALPDRSRFKGVLIGAATATKLLPGLFVVYLLLTRRFRAAVVAAGTFVGLTLLGAVIQPGGSYDYWLTGRAFDSHRVLMTSGPRYGGNQSLQGFTARLLQTDEQNTIWWMASVVVVLVAGLALATALQRHGEEAMALVVVGFTMLLISPVSWSHYWLWIGPMAIVLVDVVRRSAGVARVVAGVVAVAAILPFLMWPITYRGGLLPRGLIWSAGRLQGPAQRFAVDPYVPTVLVLFVLAALWLYRRARAEQPVVPAVGTTGA